MSLFKQVRLTVSTGRIQSNYALTLRTFKGRDITDRRLHHGVLPFPQRTFDPEDVIDLLTMAVEALEQAFPTHPRPQGPGAPGGGGGVPRTLPLQVVCKHDCPACGTHLDHGFRGY